MQEHETVSVIEECVPRALGVEVEALAHRVGYSGRVNTFSLRDEFIHCYGNHGDILAAHGLTREAVFDQVLATTKSTRT